MPKTEYLEGLDRLFFELASESRLSILCTLQAGGVRMQEIAKRLNMTDTETSRQLLRLSEASLIRNNLMEPIQLRNTADYCFSFPVLSNLHSSSRILY